MSPDGDPKKVLGLPGVANNPVVFLWPNRLDAQPRTLLDQHHVFQRGLSLQFGQGERTIKNAHQTNIDHIPYRVVRRRLGVKVIAALVPRGEIGVAFANDLSDAHNGRWRGVAVVKEDAVTNLHQVTKRVSGLIIANAVPVGCRLL